MAKDARQCPRCERSLEIGLIEVVGGEVPRTACFLKPRDHSIGRAPDNDIVLPDPSISRLHARLVFKDGRFFIEDQESRHGVVVEAESVSRAELRPGVPIRLGSVTLVFTPVDPDASTAEGLKIPPERLAGGRGSEQRPALEALNLLQIGVVLVATDGAVLFVNKSARAILDDGDGLRIDHGLRATDAAAQRELRRLLAEEPDPSRGGALSIPRASRRPLALLVTALGKEGERLDTPNAARAVFVSDPERGIGTGEETLRKLYGLTGAESRLAAELLLGKTLQESADSLAITPNTARQYLKSVFSKTGTRRQSELVRLLFSGPAQLRQS